MKFLAPVGAGGLHHFLWQILQHVDDGLRGLAGGLRSQPQCIRKSTLTRTKRRQEAKFNTSSLPIIWSYVNWMTFFFPLQGKANLLYFFLHANNNRLRHQPTLRLSGEVLLPCYRLRQFQQ